MSRYRMALCQRAAALRGQRRPCAIEETQTIRLGVGAAGRLPRRCGAGRIAPGGFRRC